MTALIAPWTCASEGKRINFPFDKQDFFKCICNRKLRYHAQSQKDTTLSSSRENQFEVFIRGIGVSAKTKSKARAEINYLLTNWRQLFRETLDEKFWILVQIHVIHENCHLLAKCILGIPSSVKKINILFNNYLRKLKAYFMEHILTLLGSHLFCIYRLYAPFPSNQIVKQRMSF